MWAQASQNSRLFKFAYHARDLQQLLHSFVAREAGQSVQTYFSLPLAPPTGNKEKYGWLARLLGKMELVNNGCLVSQATPRLDSCPVYWDECGGNLTSLTLGRGPAIVSIVSSALSCIGSLLIVYIYARWRDLRTGSRSIITFLAIADFFTAFGYVVGSSNYLVHLKNDTDPASNECPFFTDICQLQSYVTTWSSLSSFFWTFALAFYLYITIVRNRIYLANRLIPLFHVVAWALPITVCLPLLVTGYLGFAPFAASTWCFIYDQHSLTPGKIILILVAGKFWEILTYVAVVILYVAIKYHIWKEVRENSFKNCVQYHNMTGKPGVNAFWDFFKRWLTTKHAVSLILRPDEEEEKGPCFNSNG